ncbi:MlaD family protein [Mycolicibacterium holsaticum]|uniref:Mammalian cell entry protein n=1 Tax=Mycolicibacterium holsaticum TaxID=152142 RepID=A0A1E3S2Y7_9MYCO|nr:MlaD family protein [Mycolicibacterium holsaticum]ODQ96434.1 mammalian cell entry protein [Mycolicibacterium holsaticum]
MIKPRAALWRFVLASIVAALVFILTVNVLRQPVAAETRSYTAEFTDVSGLHIDADVRIRGVRVGKVKQVRLEHKAGQNIASVDFSLDSRYTVVPQTRLAIKYQALTGLRYVDVTDASESDDGHASSQRPITYLPLAMTQPSFDITSLFNGLQPVLATLSPEDIDRFTENAATYLQGDGGGLGPMLESIRKLTEFTSNRQEVIATLMQNLNAIAGTFGGHAKDFVQILEWMNRPIDATLTVLDEFRKSELYGPGFTSAAMRLLENAGFTPGAADMDEGIDRAISALYEYSDAIKRVPVIWDSIDPPAEAGAPERCSRGPAQLPASMDVLLNGQRVILCNR